MGRGYEGEAGLIKHDMSGDHDVISGKIEAVIPFVVRGIADENTSGGTRSKLMRSYCGYVGIAGTPKDSEMLVGRRCVVEGGVSGSDGFCWKTVQQICGGMEALYPILWWHWSLKQ
jgi:hypothetical protein